MSTAIESLVNREYQYGFVSDIESDTVAPGLSEDVIRIISAKKHEPEWLLDWRLKAYRRWLTMKEPHWPNVIYPPIDYQAAAKFALVNYEIARELANAPARPTWKKGDFFGNTFAPAGHPSAAK